MYPNTASKVFSHFKYHIASEKGISSEDEQSIGSEERLLENDEAEQPRLKSAKWRILCFVTGIQVFANVIWTLALLFGSIGIHRMAVSPSLIASPANEVLTYEVVETNSTVFSKNEFMGHARPGLEETWHNAYTKWAHVVVQAEDLEAINGTSIPLADGSGYLATLTVFHHLHCLDYIRMYIDRDYYTTPETPERRFEHMDHCIDAIRQALMCHGDVSLVTFRWLDWEVLPWADFNVKHECKNWDGILGWAQDHVADESAIVRPGKLVHGLPGGHDH